MVFLLYCGTCCFLLSIWAVIQLVIMGVFYTIKAVPMVDDVLPQKYDDYDDLIVQITKNYGKAAINCWISAGMYLVMIPVSAYCIIRANREKERLALALEDDEAVCAQMGVFPKTKK